MNALDLANEWIFRAMLCGMLGWCLWWMVAWDIETRKQRRKNYEDYKRSRELHEWLMKKGWESSVIRKDEGGQGVNDEIYEKAEKTSNVGFWFDLLKFVAGLALAAGIVYGVWRLVAWVTDPGEPFSGVGEIENMTTTVRSGQGFMGSFTSSTTGIVVNGATYEMGGSIELYVKIGDYIEFSGYDNEIREMTFKELPQ